MSKIKKYYTIFIAVLVLFVALVILFQYLIDVEDDKYMNKIKEYISEIELSYYTVERVKKIDNPSFDELITMDIAKINMSLNFSEISDSYKIIQSEEVKEQALSYIKELSQVEYQICIDNLSDLQLKSIHEDILHLYN